MKKQEAEKMAYPCDVIFRRVVAGRTELRTVKMLSYLPADDVARIRNCGFVDRKPLRVLAVIGSDMHNTWLDEVTKEEREDAERHKKMEVLRAKIEHLERKMKDAGLGLQFDFGMKYKIEAKEGVTLKPISWDLFYETLTKMGVDVEEER